MLRPTNENNVKCDSCVQAECFEKYNTWKCDIINITPRTGGTTQNNKNRLGQTSNGEKLVE